MKGTMQLPHSNQQNLFVHKFTTKKGRIIFFWKTFHLIFWHILEHRLSVITSNHQLVHVVQRDRKVESFSSTPTSLKVLDQQSWWPA